MNTVYGVINSLKKRLYAAARLLRKGYNFKKQCEVLYAVEPVIKIHVKRLLFQISQKHIFHSNAPVLRDNLS